MWLVAVRAELGSGPEVQLSGGMASAVRLSLRSMVGHGGEVDSCRGPEGPSQDSRIAGCGQGGGREPGATWEGVRGPGDCGRKCPPGLFSQAGGDRKEVTITHARQSSRDGSWG